MIKKVTIYLASTTKPYLLIEKIYLFGILIYSHYNSRVTSEDEIFKDYKVIKQQ
jgi:hypothetical protein